MFRVFLNVTISVWLFPISAFAQFDLSDTMFSAEEKLLFQDIPSVYSASKYDQKITEAPSSISIVTAEEIKKYGYRNMADLLASLRGMFTTNDRTYQFLGIRGFARPSDFNTRVLILIDGHRTNDAMYDGTVIGNGFLVDIDNIDRVEVIRGPSSSLYGNNAFFAVINVWTKRGRDYQGFEVSGEQRSYDTYKTRLNYGNRFSNGIEFLLSGTYLDSQGKDELYFKEFDDPSTNNGVSRKNDDEQAANLLGQLSWIDLTLRGVYVQRKKGIPTATYETLFNDKRTDLLDSHGFLDLRYEHDFEDQTKVVGRLFYDNYYYSGNYVYDFADPGDPADLVVSQDKAWAQWWGSEFWITKRLYNTHRFTVGGELRHNFRQDQKNYDRAVNLNDKRDSVNWGVFLQDEVEILNNLRLNLGVRYDHFPTFGGTTNPRLGLIYNPLPGTNLKFLYGTAFRAPSVYEKYYHDGFNTQKPNPNLDPEKIETFEFIVEQSLGGSLRGTASLFYNKIDDLITFVTDPNDGLLFNENLQDAETLGVEVALEGKILRTVDSRVSYSFQNTEDRDTGVKLTNSPAHLAKLNLIGPLYQETLFGSLGMQYVSTRKTLAGTRTDDYLLTSLSLFSRLKNIPVLGGDWIRGLEISGTVYNLFDQHYGDPGSEEHLQNQIPQDGRTYRIKLTLEF
ncbi:MAG TPA: TonB-dependent receptor [Nitrospirales bacterium]|nr:TonB-dependent receptor [Nitrospirales bacterium]